MGKNRTTTYEKKYFVTRAGIEVPLEGHSEEWMKEFNDKIHNWIIYSNNVSPSDKMTDEELDYIFSHMNNSQDDVPSGMLTRVEKARHLLPLIESGELGVGSVLPSSSILRSYSKTQLATLDYVHDFPTDVIIFRTHGKVNFFDTEPFDNAMGKEKEVWVEQGQLRIDNITTFNKNDYPMNDPERDYMGNDEYSKAISNELGVPFDVDVWPPSVTFIDVSPV